MEVYILLAHSLLFMCFCTGLKVNTVSGLYTFCTRLMLKLSHELRQTCLTEWDKLLFSA